MVEDAELLQRFAREGCQSAFAELVRRHLDRAYSVALRAVGGDAHLAQDVAQTVFANLARKAARLTNHPALSAWIHRVTHDAAVDAVRRETRRRARETKACAMHELNDASAHDEAWEKLRPELDAVMAGLPERDRSALALRFFDDRTFAEIGRRLGLSEDAARMRVDRALDTLRRLLAGRGITGTTAALGAMLSAPGLVAAPAGLASSVSTSALAMATAASAGTLASLMSSTKCVAGAAAAIVVLAVGTTTYQHFAYVAPEPEEVPAANAGPSAEILRLEARAAAVQAETEAIRAELAALRKARVEVTMRLSVPQRTTNTAAEELGRAFMERHPEVRHAFHAWKDAQTRLDYGALFRKLRLTPEQIEQFLTVKRANGMVSGTWGPSDTLMTLRVEGSGPAGDMESILGQEAFAVYREYERAKMERRASMQAASYLCFTDEPLSTEQTDELTRIFAQNRLRQAPGTAAERYDWSKILAQAADILTPAQRPVLDALRADDRYRLALNGWMP